MDLYNRTENAALGDELIVLIDKWPDCDQERAIELQRAFNEFTDKGGWDDPEVKKWGPRDGPIYIIKRDPNPQRQIHYKQASDEIQAEIGRRDGKSDSN
jgi:hypothetical protein